ncbi:MAG: Ig-like domain-containing protein [Candidatus Latescibacter sp.]|nr:Ig-like domain-containing protein [Candidatus Latescibacter sp.]
MKRSMCLMAVSAVLALTTFMVSPGVTYAKGSGPITTVTVSPDSATVQVGGEIQFSAKALDAGGAAVDTTFTWSVNRTDLGSIDKTGLFKALKAGEVIITATAGVKKGNARVTVIAGSATTGGATAKKVEISPKKETVIVGKTLQFEAAARDSLNRRIQTVITWSVSDQKIGSVDGNGLFKGLAAGSVMVIAKAGAVSDTAKVTVIAEQPPVQEPTVAILQIYPEKASVAVGATVKFEAGLKDAKGNEVQATVKWAVNNKTLGSVDDTGLFKALAAGDVQVIASTGAAADTAFVTVTQGEPPVDAGVNQVAIFRQLPDGKITKFGSGTVENGTVTIGGIPHPLNFLNGMKLTFPKNSLHEDITITFKLPVFAKVDDVARNVTFGDNIVAGVTFEVTVDGAVKSPYKFDIPLELTLPFKRGLLDKMGITPSKIGMFFASASGQLQNDPGITDVKVDSLANVITGKVAHFSTIVIAPAPTGPTEVENSIPQDFQLLQNMPNPFNPTTIIAFRIPEASWVTLSIYNILGQEVKTLVNSRMNAGRYSVVWDATDSRGATVTSGVYFYLLKAGGKSTSMKLMFMK